MKKRHAEAAFDGEGACRHGGRWNSPGTPVVYASETRALGLLEILVGIRSAQPLNAYVLIAATFDDSLVTTVDFGRLPETWRQSPPPSSTQRIGDEWVARKTSAILRVPSAIIPEEFNYVLNPAHQQFARIEIGALSRYAPA